MQVLFLHGRESGPEGSKIRMLRDAGWPVEAPDCRGIEDVHERVAIARDAVRRPQEPTLLVGSSMGGLTAALLWSELSASAESPPIEGVLLLAPALNWADAVGVERVHPRTTVVHGDADDLVPVEASRAFVEQFGCRYVEVKDGHRLADSHPTILAELQAMASRVEPAE